MTFYTEDSPQWTDGMHFDKVTMYRRPEGSSVQSLDRLGGIVDDSAQILFQSFLQEAHVSNSRIGKDVDSLMLPRCGELRTQKLKSQLVRTQNLNVLPLKRGVGQHIAIHAALTARDFFLAYFCTSGPFTCIFFPNLSRFFLCWLWLTHGSCVGPQNKIGHPARCRFSC